MLDVNVMMSRWRFIPPKALEERITSEKDASLETSEYVSESQKTMAAATVIQEGIIIWTVSSTMIIVMMAILMAHSYAYFPSAVGRKSRASAAINRQNFKK